MRIASLEFTPVSVPYTHREVSSLINRDGVTDIIVKATTDDGLVGWGESCSGADVTSVLGALQAMKPFVIGQSPWESERIRQELWHRGIWSWRQHTACFAYPGIDMALWDICGKASLPTVVQPVWRQGPRKRKLFLLLFPRLAGPYCLASAGRCREGIQGLLFESRVGYRGGTGDGPVSSRSHRATGKDSIGREWRVEGERSATESGQAR